MSRRRYDRSSSLSSRRLDARVAAWRSSCAYTYSSSRSRNSPASMNPRRRRYSRQTSAAAPSPSPRLPSPTVARGSVRSSVASRSVCRSRSPFPVLRRLPHSGQATVPVSKYDHVAPQSRHVRSPRTRIPIGRTPTRLIPTPGGCPTRRVISAVRQEGDDMSSHADLLTTEDRGSRTDAAGREILPLV